MFVAAGAGDAAAQLAPEDVARVEWIEETAISPDGQWVAYVRSMARSPTGDQAGAPGFHFAGTSPRGSRPATGITIFNRYFGGDPWVQREAPTASIDPAVSRAVIERGL